jgi:endonuclease/exonuclease/phosphatase family metal-dependent hydrolase
MERGKQTPRFSACPAIPIPSCRDLPLVFAGRPVALPLAPRHPQGAGGGRFEPTTFDYIMTKGLGSPRADLIDVPEEASDHRPVALEIELSAR